MNADEFLINLITFLPAFIVKGFVVLFLILHLLFSIIVLRQTRLMNTVLEAKIAPGIYLFSLIHLLSSIFVFIWVIIYM